jgi:hypothetical protein
MGQNGNGLTKQQGRVRHSHLYMKMSNIKYKSLKHLMKQFMSHTGVILYFAYIKHCLKAMLKHISQHLLGP